MRWRRNKRITIGGLLVLVAVCAVLLSLLRPPAPPDEGQAILLAKAYLQARDEFDYPRGYWARAIWNSKQGTWRVGFVPASRNYEGGSYLVEVSPDRSCRTAPMDFSFFDLW
jgi:hypothetical protein